MLAKFQDSVMDLGLSESDGVVSTCATPCANGKFWKEPTPILNVSCLLKSDLKLRFIDDTLVHQHLQCVAGSII